LEIINIARRITNNWFFWLALITGIAIIIRSLPAWTNAAWGCDFGIYYSLTNSFVESGELFNSYYGWGGSYQYFPVLYAITGFAHWITGLDVITIMPKIVPIFGGLSIMVFYFVVWELTGDKRIAILSSLILTVLPFHAYQTSHASPLTMGHFFMMLSIYFFIKYRQDLKYLMPLFISTILLIMSHHLTTYFYLISLVSIVVIENASKKEWKYSLKLDIFYILSASVFIFSYWRIIATPVYDNFMKTGLKIGELSIESNIVIILFYILFSFSFIIIWLKRRFNIFFIRKEPTYNSYIVKFFITIILCLIIMGIFSFVKMPWTNFSFTPLSIFFSLPLLVIIGFGVAAYRYTRFIKNGFFIRGWLIAILISFTFGVITNSWTLYPHRHLEYLMIPLSIISIYGIKNIFLHHNYESLSKWIRKLPQISSQLINQSRKTRFVRKRQIIFMFVVIFVVTTNAVSIYPSHLALNASYEAITNENLSVIDWIKENLDKNNSVVASDHRLSRMIEAVGFNTTLDETIFIWDAINISDYLDELYGIGKNHSKITHILIDDIMKERVVHVGFGKIVYMTNESYDKFTYQPYEIEFRNATMNQNNEEVHWTVLYRINWTFIEDFNFDI
jgi:hypothetical protein